MSHRLPFITEKEMTDRQREMVDQFKKFSLNGMRGPFNMMLRSPEAAERFQALGKYLRFETGLDERLMELVVLVHARIWHDQYEWFLHEPRAVEAKLTASTIEALKIGKVPSNLLPDEEALFNYVLELEITRSVRTETLEKARAVFNDQIITDLVFILGQYATISMLLAVLEEGKELDLLPPCTQLFSEYFQQ